MPDFTKDVKEFTTTDLLDAIYGQIQAITERGSPDNVIFHYFLPPVPFGPELASFMDIGTRPAQLENTNEGGETIFNVNDLARAAVNFAVLADYIPTIGDDPLLATEETDTVDLNSLIASGKRVSDIYHTVLLNCKVIDNSLSEKDQAKLEKLRRLLYEEPPEVSDEPDEDELLEALEDEEDDIDLDALLGEEGADAGDFVQNPDQLLAPTRLMKLYRALENRYYQVEMATLEKAAQISNNDPNRGIKIRAIKNQRENALRRWEVQGKKKQVEAVMAKIAVLSRGGMPQYLDKLQRRVTANQLTASVFAASDEGAGLLTEDALYTALRPNGILNAPALMKVRLKSSKAKTWSKTSKSKTSGGLKIPVYSLLGSASGSKSTESAERSFFKEDFELSFEIVQGVIDRPWLDVSFLESRAYTTVDPDTKKPLDTIHEIVTLSDGGVPPKEGLMPAIPMTAYFARDLVVKSSTFATMSDTEKKKFSGRAGISFLGFGARGKHTSSTTEASWGRAAASGELSIKGQFLIGMASRFLEKAPDPDFESHPNADDWV